MAGVLLRSRLLIPSNLEKFVLAVFAGVQKLTIVAMSKLL